MKIILFPTDFSENANDALEYLLQMHKGCKVHLHIIHVIDPRGYIIDSSISSTQILDQFRNAAEVEVKLIKERVENLKQKNNETWEIKTEVIIGYPASTIVATAKKMEADLIVIGNKGSNISTSDKILGITSLQLTEEAKCPVLLIPKSYKYIQQARVLYPTTLDYIDPFLLWKAMNALAPIQPIIHCLYVINQEEELTKEEKHLAKFLVEHSSSIQTIFDTERGSHKEIINIINSYRENHDCKMIIMHKSRKSFFTKLFSKSTTKKMREKINVPLLVLNTLK